MTKEEKFAESMSVLLLQMRGEDLAHTTLYDDYDTEIPDEFIDKILDDETHTTAIKKLIYKSVLDAVTMTPYMYTEKDGNYGYTAPHTYDHSYLVDTYIEEQYPCQKNHTLHVCAHCHSDNVQIKAWIRPNQGNLVIDIDNQADELGWCDDCNKPAVIETAEYIMADEVIGFQVVNDMNEPHPDMDASFCVYNLEQANEMIKTDKNIWNLLAIRKSDIEEPTLMFEGNVR